MSEQYDQTQEYKRWFVVAVIVSLVHTGDKEVPFSVMMREKSTLLFVPSQIHK